MLTMRRGVSFNRGVPGGGDNASPSAPTLKSMKQRANSLAVRQMSFMSPAQQNMATVLASLPPSFELVKVSDGEVELCPGIRLASMTKAPEGTELPPGAAYCYVNSSAPVLKGIRRLPFFMLGQYPDVKGCELLLLPPVLQLMEGVNLILGAKLPPNTVLPPNVMIIQRDSVAMATRRLPKGVREVQLSTLLKTPPQLKLPSLIRDVELKGKDNLLSGKDGSSLILVQMHTSVTMPAGVEVSPGCEIAETADDTSLPHGVQLLRCHDDCESFPAYMTPLKVLTINERLLHDADDAEVRTYCTAFE